MGDRMIPMHNHHDTSREAAVLISSRVTALREKVLTLVGQSMASGMTVHETAAAMGESVPSVQPRFSELLHRGKIRDAGKRRKNASGRNAIVWIRA